MELKKLKPDEGEDGSCTTKPNSVKTVFHLNLDNFIFQLDDMSVDDLGLQDKSQQIHGESSDSIDVSGMVIVRMPWEMREDRAIHSVVSGDLFVIKPVFTFLCKFWNFFLKKDFNF